jgi:hypothetical protein
MPKPKRKSNPELPKSVSAALSGQKAAIDSASLLSNLIEVWGGPARLAADIFDEFGRAPEGGQTRQRILEMMQRLIINNTERDLTNTVKPSDLSDAELEELALAYVRRLTNAAPSTTAASATPKEEGSPNRERADTEAVAGGDGESDDSGFAS